MSEIIETRFPRIVTTDSQDNGDLANAVVPSGTKSITNNGTGIDVAEYEKVDVAVPASAVTSGTKSITSNGTGIDVTNYKKVNVNVPTGASTETDYPVNGGTRITIKNNSSVPVWVLSKSLSEYVAPYNQSYVINRGTNLSKTDASTYSDYVLAAGSSKSFYGQYNYDAYQGPAANVFVDSFIVKPMSGSYTTITAVANQYAQYFTINTMKINDFYVVGFFGQGDRDSVQININFS